MAEVLRRRRRPIVVGCLSSTLHQTCEALVPVAIGVVVDSAVRTGDGRAMAVAVLAVLALFALLTAAGNFAFVTIDTGKFHEAHHLRVAVLRAVLTHPRAARETHPRAARETHPRAVPERQAGELLSIATSDTRATAEVLGLLSWLTSASAGLLVSAVVLLRIDAVLGVGLLVAVPLLVLGLQSLAPRLERRVHVRQQTAGLAAASAADLLAGLRPLRGFGGVPEAVRRYAAVSRTSQRAAVGAATSTSVVLGASTLATGALLVATAGVAGSFALQGRISTGELVTVVGMASFLSDPVRTISTCVQQLAVARAGAGRVAGVLDAPAGPDGPTGPSGPQEAPGSKGSAGPGPLHLDGVRLGDVAVPDLELAPGELLGVATTRVAVADAITAVLAGRRVPDAGTARLGTTPLEQVRARDLHERLLVEPHAVHLLGDTLGAALDTGPAPTGRGVAPERALAAAAAGDLLHPRSGGLDAPLAESGTNLSGGQRQRLALARALAADRPVLVLRDPTTAVDAVTEDHLAQGVAALRRERADGGTLVVTTSPLLLARCDRVLFVADDGSARTATHEELLADAGYAAAVLR